jgi:hypothetical protein
MLVTGVLCEDDHGDDSEPGGDCGGPYRLAEQQCGPDQCEHRLGECPEGRPGCLPRSEGSLRPAHLWGTARLIVLVPAVSHDNAWAGRRSACVFRIRA